MCENEWRVENCPSDYAPLYCTAPFACAQCEGAWHCEDIYNISVEVLAYYDTNGDGSINLADNIEEEHLNEINAYCDYDGNA
jgi:hypothetical protein